jgi:putative ATPase
MAPKSDAAYRALNAAREEAQTSGALPVPLQIRNAPTRAMKDWGYGKGYQHAHSFEDAEVDMECLPPELVGKEFYHPTQRGVEARLYEKLAHKRKTERNPQDPL